MWLCVGVEGVVPLNHLGVVCVFVCVCVRLEKSPHLETKAPRRHYPAGRAFLHHPRLNTFSLTVETEADGDPPDLQRDVEELRRYALSHRHSTVISC